WTAAPTRTSFALGFRRPYTKKKNAASATKKSVRPNMLDSYFKTDLIWLAGKNATTIATTVVTSPLPPAKARTLRLYRPLTVDAALPGANENFNSAPNI